MEEKLINHCTYLYDRTMENVKACLDLANEMKTRGLEDLRLSVSLVQQHRVDTRRLFSRDRLADLKFCKVCVRCANTRTRSLSHNNNALTHSSLFARITGNCNGQGESTAREQKC